MDKEQTCSAECQTSLYLKSLMKRYKVTQKQMAEKFGVTACAISYRLRSAYRWSVRELMVIAPVFNMEPEELIAAVQANVAAIA